MTTYLQGSVAVLSVQWYAYVGGPAASVTNDRITITRVADSSAVIGPTASGVVNVGTGLDRYSWTVPVSQTPGAYQVTWNATDENGSAVQAVEIITVATANGTLTDAVLPSYCTREMVKAALDVKLTARSDPQVDRAIDAASRSIEGQMGRVFYPIVATRYFDWPNYQYAAPWRLWLNQWELADSADLVVTSGGVTIPAADVFCEPANSGPPYTYIELDRSTAAAFGVGTTPQRNVAVTGTFGYWAKTVAGGTLNGAVSDVATTVTVTNGAAVGVGDNILVDAERMVVRDKTMTSTGATQQSGLTTANVGDVSLGVTSGAAYSVGEVLTLGSERVLVVDITGNTLTVKRAWDGTVLAAHTGATIYAARQLTVTRGALGTVAAAHVDASDVNVTVVPGLIRDLAVAEAVVQLTQEAGGYAGSQGGSEGAQSGVGRGLPGLRDRALTAYGRKVRYRAV